MSTKQHREEKKRVDDLLSRVKEVVHNASNEEILCTLVFYDFDAEKAIQAFCEDGAREALSSWEKSGAAKKNKSRKKKNSKATDAQAPPASAEPAIPEPAVRTVKRGNHVNGGLSTKIRPAAPATTTGTLMPVVRSTGKVASGPLVIDPPALYKSTTDSEEEEKACSLGISSLKNCADQLKGVETGFEKELNLSEEGVRSIFKGIRQFLSDRENHLIAELRRTHDDGLRVLKERRVKAAALLDRSKRMSLMSDREKKGFRDELTLFSMERDDEDEFAHAPRFLCDNKQLIKIIKNFGEVAGIKPAGIVGASVISPSPSGDATSAADVKNSMSQSSCASSVGEDSGLGQISPGAEEPKHVAMVCGGGITMKSDALSKAELDNLNAKVLETLKEKGVDMSLFGEATVSARRRPGANARKTRPPKPSPPLPDPKLSIFE